MSNTLDHTRQERLAAMAKRLGQNDSVATDPADIAEAAKASRVDKLFISHTTPHPTISEALWNTLGAGGEVFFAGDFEAMPDSGVVALLRY